MFKAVVSNNCTHEKSGKELQHDIHKQQMKMSSNPGKMCTFL